jgi:hypothetical protein
MEMVVRAFLTIGVVCATGCSLMAPSDTELMGDGDAAVDAKDSSGDCAEDGSEASPPCMASGGACITDTDCCSTKCRGGICH